MTFNTLTSIARPMLLTAIVLALAGCPQADSGQTGGTVASGSGTGTERLVHIESRFGERDQLLGDASYKVRKRKGTINKQFKVELENAEPGTTYEITLNGVALGTLIVGIDGEGELEFEDEFPDAFVEPEAGATVGVGDAFNVTLEPLERLIALVAEIEGAAEGEASYKKEQLAGTTYRELEVEVEEATPGTYDVTLDGAPIGELEVDDEGEGKIKLGGRDGDPFPDGFSDPSAGSVLKIGADLEVKLERDD